MDYGGDITTRRHRQFNCEWSGVVRNLVVSGRPEMVHKGIDMLQVQTDQMHRLPMLADCPGACSIIVDEPMRRVSLMVHDVAYLMVNPSFRGRRLLDVRSDQWFRAPRRKKLRSNCGSYLRVAHHAVLEEAPEGRRTEEVVVADYSCLCCSTIHSSR